MKRKGWRGKENVNDEKQQNEEDEQQMKNKMKIKN